MEYGLPSGRYEKISSVLHRFPSIDEVILFGSRAIGNFKPASDIDLALIGDEIPYSDLQKLQRALDELPYGYYYDVLDYKKITLPEIKKHIDNFGISFYKKEVANL